MRTIESNRTKARPHIHLKLRQRIRLSLVVMLVLFAFLAGAGVWYGMALEAGRQGVLLGKEQLQRVDNLQQKWTGLSDSIDQVLITRQTGLIDEQLNARISEFNRLATSLQGYDLGLTLAGQAANHSLSRELNTLSMSLTDTTAHMTQAGQAGRWVSYAWLRHTQVKPLELQVETIFATLKQNIQKEIDQAESAAPEQIFSYYLFSSLLVVGLIAAGGLDLALNFSIYGPLKAITTRMQAVNQGDLSPYQGLPQQDELGELSKLLSSVIQKMEAQVVQLETRVSERTQDLERGRAQMQVSSQVAREIAASQDLPALLNNAVTLIRERFGFYHAGIFLVDDSGEYAVLRAATGEAGREMLSRQHRLKVGETGLVGYVTRRGEARVAADVGEDVTHFRNPLLPDTRSEMALPLKAGETIIGALDVQSVEPAAFGADDITVLQTLADQLAVAIENVRLVERLQSSLAELEVFYGHQRGQVWEQFSAGRALQGYRFERSGSAPIRAGEAEPGTSGEYGDPLHIPLEIRGATIGTLEVWPESQQVTREEKSLLANIAGRISQALESARLFEEAQARASREQVINQIATSISRSMDVDALLQTAVHELGQIPHVMEVSVHVGPPEILAGEHSTGTGES